MKRRPKSPKSSVDIGEYMGGAKQHVLDEAVRGAVRDAIELNELLDKQKARRDSEARARAVAIGV